MLPAPSVVGKSLYILHATEPPWRTVDSPGVSSATALKTSGSSTFIFLVWTFRIASLPAASGTSTLTIRSNLYHIIDGYGDHGGGRTEPASTTRDEIPERMLTRAGGPMFSSQIIDTSARRAGQSSALRISVVAVRWPHQKTRC